MTTNYKEVVTSALEKHLAEHPRIFSNELYELVKGQLTPVCELADFKPWLSKFCKESSTFESVKGRYGGIKFRSEDRRVGSAAVTTSDDGVTADDTEEDDDEIVDDACSVMINSKNRIHATDRRNWVIQRLNQNTWVSLAYYPSLELAFKGMAKKLLNNELKAELTTAQQLKEFGFILENLENKLENLIKKSYP